MCMLCSALCWLLSQLLIMLIHFTQIIIGIVLGRIYLGFFCLYCSINTQVHGEVPFYFIKLILGKTKQVNGKCFMFCNDTLRQANTSSLGGNSSPPCANLLNFCLFKFSLPKFDNFGFKN